MQSSNSNSRVLAARTPQPNRSVRAGLLAGLCLLATSCGPAAIGVGLGSGGGGNGGPSGPAPIVVSLRTNDRQPDDDRTLLALDFAQREGRRLRVRFEYDIGQGRVRVPSSSLALYDAQGVPTGVALDVDGGDNVLLSTAGGNGAVQYSWNHAADLGQVEVRGVSLYAIAVLEDEFDAAFDSADPAVPPAFQVFGDRVLGRELSEISEVFMIRGSANNPESEFVVSCILRDFGGDRETTDFSFRYALTNDTPTASDFTLLPPLSPTEIEESVEPDGRVRSRVVFSFDPIALGVPLGTYGNFWVSLQHSESYSPDRAGVPPVVKFGDPVLVNRPGEQVGFAPRIESASVVDPSNVQLNQGDPLRPWLRLPITVEVYNPSPTLPMLLQLDAFYTILGTKFTITRVESDDPRTAETFTLAPLERRAQYVIWNVVADEGLGLPVISDGANNPALDVVVDVVVSVLGAGNSPLAGLPLEDEATAGPTRLSTLPFVDFTDNLLPLARRFWSSGNDITQQTRDIFFTQGGASTQETRLGLNQRFEPKQIVPAPDIFDWFPQFTNGVFDIVPTDVDPNRPDCLVWINNEFNYVTWSEANGAEPLPIGTSNTTLNARGATPLGFTLGTGADARSVAVFFTWSEQTLGTAPNLFKRIDIQLTRVIRDGVGWSVIDGPVETFEIAGTPPVNIRPVGGDFDGDPDTYELVFGTQGTELATVARPGLLHMWSFGLDGNGDVTQGLPQPLPPLPPPAAGTPDLIDPWLMESWRPIGNARAGLVVVRQRTGGSRSLIDVLELSQVPTGGFTSAWSLVSDDLDSEVFDILGSKLEKIFTADIDGNSAGIVGSDLMLVLAGDDSPTTRVGDVWIYARRASGPPVWRRIIDNLRARDPNTLEIIAGEGEVDGSNWQLVDVNGDRLLDLVTAEAPGPNGLQQAERHYNYRASALAGVAGKLDGVLPSAGAPTALPGLIDGNGDGSTDIVSDGRLHVSNPNGSYTPVVVGLTAGPQVRYQVERLFYNSPADVIEVVATDPSPGGQNRISRITGVGPSAGGSPSIVPLSDFDLGGPVQILRVLTGPDSAARTVRDLVGLQAANGAPAASLVRGRIDAGTGAVTAESLWNGEALLSAGMALLRRGELPPIVDLQRNRLSQDVVVVDAANPGRVVVFDASNGYQSTFVDMPANQQIVRIAGSAVGDDARDDLIVLTVEDLGAGNRAYRLLVFEQDAATGSVVGVPSLEYAKFAAPYAASAIRAFEFDRGARTLANGFLLIDDEASSDRSEIRLIRPVADGVSLSARLVVSPVAEGVDADIDAVVLDANADGQIEVVAGDRSGGQGLRRLRTNVGGQ
ncbi:MAG: hypothetical protein AB8H80_08640 [Planctomycetota bacterium]